MEAAVKAARSAPLPRYPFFGGVAARWSSLCRVLTYGGFLCAAATAVADDLRFVAPLGGSLNVPVVSLKEARFVSTTHQQYDFSCGSAAVATLLTHHYGWRVEESQVFQAMFERGDREKIRREGFSMLDMKQYLDSKGFQASGVETTLDQLAKAKIPGIVLINENGYTHFVVIKGLHADEVLIGDPAAGTRIVKRAELERSWINNIALVVVTNTQLARFDRNEDWRIRPKAPLRDSLEGNAADVLLLRRGPLDF